MSVVSCGRKKSKNLLRETGKSFIDGFIRAYPNSVILRAKEPTFCWKAAGQVAFAVVSEFSGPNSVDENAPVLFRLMTNLNPPMALLYHLQSPAVRHTLGVQPNPLILKEPALELTGAPDEIGDLGSWLAQWFDAQFLQRTSAPMPPAPLLSLGWNEDLTTRKDLLTSIGPNWRYHLYLWTPLALEQWEDWLDV